MFSKSLKLFTVKFTVVLIIAPPKLPWDSLDIEVIPADGVKKGFSSNSFARPSIEEFGV